MAKKHDGVMNIILVVLGVFLLLFTIAMILIFLRYEAIPDTLVSSVFLALGGECGAMAWIKSTKEKYKEREWEVEDRKNDNNNENDIFIGEDE